MRMTLNRGTRRPDRRGPSRRGVADLRPAGGGGRDQGRAQRLSRAHTSPELVLEVIDGLRSAGIKLKDMVVFDRYGLEFREARYQEILPDGVA